MSQNRLAAYRPGIRLAADGVGEPAGSEEAAKRRAEVIRPVGPTLIRSPQNYDFCLSAFKPARIFSLVMGCSRILTPQAL